MVLAERYVFSLVLFGPVFWLVWCGVAAVSERKEARWAVHTATRRLRVKKPARTSQNDQKKEERDMLTYEPLDLLVDRFLERHIPRGALSYTLHQKGFMPALYAAS